MAKQGMKRPEPERKKNEFPPVPEISGKARHGHNKARPLISGEAGKVFRDAPQGSSDLGFENRMNDLDMTAADLQDFWRKW